MLLGAAGGGAVAVIGVDEVLGDSLGTGRKAAAGVAGAVAGASVGYALCTRAYRQKRDLEERFAQVEAELAATRAEMDAERAHTPNVSDVPEEPIEIKSPRPEVVQDQIVRLELGSALLFETDEKKLSARARPYLDALAASLNENPTSKVAIIGHTDDAGSEEYNLSLSKQRAGTIADYLTTQGVLPGRLQTTGRGETEPVDTNETPQGRAQNRRVEVYIIPQTPPTPTS